MLLLVDLLPAQNQRSVSCICFKLTLLKWQNEVKVDLKHFNLVKKSFLPACADRCCQIT